MGHQSIAMFYGAELINISPVVHGQTRKIRITKPSLIFKNLPQSFNVGLYHSWVVNEKTLPEELEITALSEDNLIMGIASRKHNVYGVQFHPESYITENGFTILKNFIYI